ncbi:PHP domain-containing protein [Neisseria sp. Ec49-e6-T10]|uniref:PHP domain-containing protein n=1 Tax=Neisseria sp. Ec49-e6-T10 TaxID=3140744 RepID=UPI003EBD9D9D
MQIDLHCHSYISDGQLSPTQLMQLAHQNGTQMIALTDHDHLGGIQEARDAAQLLGLQFISGVEVSTTWRGRSIHIVGLNVDEHNQQLQTQLAQVRSGRLERLLKMSDRFDKKGIHGVYEGALALSENTEMVGRAHIARFLVKEGHVKNMNQAFKKYLGDGKSAYVAHEWASIPEAISWIRQAGGIAVIAHPGRYAISATAMRSLIEEFKDAGGEAIEVACSCHKQNEIINYALLAQRYELFSSVGSDFHAIGEGGRVLGQPPSLPVICRPVWTEFRVN